MTHTGVASGGLPPRPPRRELLSHSLDLNKSDYYSSGDDGGDGPSSSSSRNARRSCGGGGGSGTAQPLSGVSADCEGHNWKASVQQFDNFLCRVHAQVRRGDERGVEGKQSQWNFHLVPFFSFT